MSRFAKACFIILSGFVFSSSKWVDLDAPLPKENGTWKQVTGQITLLLKEDEREEALRFIAEEKEEHKAIDLSLEKPSRAEEVEAFLDKCCQMLEQKGSGVGAIVATGKSLSEYLQQWFAKNKVQEDLTTPNLKGIVFGAPSIKIVTKEKQTPSVQIKYQFQLPKIQTLRDLRKMWSFALIQRMTELRLYKQKLTAQVQEGSSFLLPEKTAAFEVQETALQGFLKSMQEIKQVGFTIEELSETKKYFLTKIEKLHKENPTKPMPVIANFHAEGFLRNVGLVSYAYFLESAPNLIESINPVDIAIVLNECFEENRRHITLFAPAALAEEFEMQIRKAIEESGKLSIDRTLEPKATEADPGEDSVQMFYQLPITDGDKELIYKIVDTMARDNVIKLGLKRKSMERKGKKIRYLHPLRFLGHVFADRHLRSCMREISRSSFKWNGFVDGMKDRIKEEAAKGNLLKFVHGFALHVHGDEKKIYHMIEKHDWEGLVRCLL
jgi:hypothetical protein